MRSIQTRGEQVIMFSINPLWSLLLSTDERTAAVAIIANPLFPCNADTLEYIVIFLYTLGVVPVS